MSAPLLILDVLTPALRNNPYIPWWIVVLLSVQTGIMALLYFYSPEIFAIPFQAMIDKRLVRNMKEMQNSFQVKMMKWMDVVFFLSISFILFNLITSIPNFIFAQGLHATVLFLLILALFVSIYYLKLFSFLFVSWLFDEKEKYYTFFFNVGMYIKIIGIILYPLILLSSWKLVHLGEYFYIYLFISFIAGYLLTLLWSFIQTEKKTIVDFINFFLYICAFELAPLLLIYKNITF